LGPAITFLFSGPAINIVAMFLIISILGLKIDLARIIVAISLSILVGLSIQGIFREKTEKGSLFAEKYKIIVFFAAMIDVLIVNGLQIDKVIKYILMVSLATLTAGIVKGMGRAGSGFAFSRSFAEFAQYAGG